MKYVYLLRQVSDDACYPSIVVAIYASRASAQSHFNIYAAKCAERSGLPVDHEDFWDDSPCMYVQQFELLD
jgi:hypothetical protein